MLADCIVAVFPRRSAVGLRRLGCAELTLRAGHNDFRSETGPAYLARHLAGVTVETYPGDLDIPAVKPVLSYLASMAAEPLTPRGGNRAGVRPIQDRRRWRLSGHKHTLLITAVR